MKARNCKEKEEQDKKEEQQNTKEDSTNPDVLYGHKWWYRALSFVAESLGSIVGLAIPIAAVAILWYFLF